MKFRFLIVILFLASLAIMSAQVPQAPTSVAFITRDQLQKLIEGDGCQISDYTAFVESIGEPAVLEHLGMKKVEQDNSLLEEYQLDSPIHVFNRDTSRICFASAGILAIFEATDPDSLAKEFKLAPYLRAPGKVLFARFLRNALLDSDETGLRLREIICLNVSTVTSHPGCTLAGCEYRVEVQ